MQQLQKSKKTELEDIPKDWSFKKIRELLDEKIILEIQDGNHGELHPKLADFIEKGIPFLTANCIINNRISFDNCKYLSELWLKKLRIGFAKESDVILTHKGTLGLCAIVPSGIKNIILSPQTTYYRLSPQISSTFLFYFFQSNIFQNQLIKMGRQSTRDYVGITSQKSLILVIPPLKEQQKIASILSKVEELIQKTEQIIEQTQRLKKGLMQRLLTKGIGHTKFKKTELGEMPEEWDLFKIEQIKSNSPNAITMGPFGSNITANNFVPSGVPVIRGINLTKEPFNMNGFVFLTDKKADELKSANAFAGDIIFTHRGTLGQVGLIPNNTQYKRYVVSQSQMKLTCDLTKVEPLYVYYFFVSAQGQNALLSNIHGTGVPAIGQPTTTLKQIKIPVPPLSEQRKISNHLTLLNEMIEIEKKRKNIIEYLKKGLMQQLLTGKIRVKV